MPDRRAISPAHRRTSLATFAVFVALLVTPGLYQVAYGFRGQEIARWCEWLREEAHAADAFRRIEADLDARFFLATTIRRWRADAYAMLPRSPAQWVNINPRATYLFVEADAAVPRAAGFMDRRFPNPTHALAALVDLDAKLAARRIHLIVVPIPSKSSIYPDKLEPEYDVARGPDLNAGHAAWFAALRDANVDAIDLADTLWQERARERSDPSAATFTLADSHWTWHAVALAADAIAAHAAPFLTDVLRRAGLHREVLHRVRSSDLLTPSGLAPPTESEDRAFLLDADDKTRRADDADAAIVVLGDSFAAGHADDGSGLPQAIEFATNGVPTRSAAVYGGSVFTMRGPLADPNVIGPHVRVVVFAFAMRHLITSDWPPVPVAGTR